MNRLLYIKIAIPLFILLLIVLAPAKRYESHIIGNTMGTTYNVKFYADEKLDEIAVKQEIDDALVLVNKQMSTYDPTSELSLFNQSESTDWVSVSPATQKVVLEAIRLGELSNGVLDVTVGPLVNLWGFGPDARPEVVPAQEQIDAVRLVTGLDKLDVSEAGLKKTVPGLYVDLSTIAKGYGVDVVAELLEAKGLTDYLVEIGGEMRVSGIKDDEMPWMIAIERPTVDQRAVQRILDIGTNAIATSGDYRNYYERDGKRYSHLIDPRTGYPIQHNLVSVSVVHSSSMTADGLATALNVMGAEEAKAVAERENLAVLLITQENGEFNEYTSPAFKQAVNILK